MPKKILIFFLLISSIHLFSQENRQPIFGKIKTDSLSVQDIHIFNISSRKGTISNKYGEFKIPVKVKDTISVSGLQFKPQKIIIKKSDLTNLLLTIYLKSKINELAEVIIKKHNLSGNLVNDAANTKDDSKISPVLSAPNAWKVDMRIVDDIDALDGEKPPDASKLTNPNAPIGGNILGILTSLVLNPLIKEASKIGQKKRELKKVEKQFQKDALTVPDKIRAELGDSFFTNTLHIPINQIEPFIRFCDSKGIMKLYLNGNKIEVIDILIKESKTYLKELKK